MLAEPRDVEEREAVRALLAFGLGAHVEGIERERKREQCKREARRPHALALSPPVADAVGEEGHRGEQSPRADDAGGVLAHNKDDAPHPEDILPGRAAGPELVLVGPGATEERLDLLALEALFVDGDKLNRVPHGRLAFRPVRRCGAGRGGTCKLHGNNGTSRSGAGASRDGHAGRGNATVGADFIEAQRHALAPV